MKILSIIFIAFFMFFSPFLIEGQYFDRIQPNGEKVSPQEVLEQRTPAVIIENGGEKILIIPLNDTLAVCANKRRKAIKLGYSPSNKNKFYFSGLDSSGFTVLSAVWVGGLKEVGDPILLKRRYAQKVLWISDFLRIHMSFVKDSCSTIIDGQALAKWYYSAQEFEYMQFRYNFETYMVLKGPGEVSFIMYKWKKVHHEYQIIPFMVKDNIIFCQHPIPFIEQGWALGLKNLQYTWQQILIISSFLSQTE